MDILAAANIKKTDTVLEIGPGLGTLTMELARQAKRIIAVEKDGRICEILNGLLENQGIDNVKIINADILKVESWKLEIGNSFKIVANLPYYIVSPVIRKFLEAKRPPKEMILMVQKEVAQRICAKPPKMNLLAVAVQFYAGAKIIRYVKKSSFWPQPKVDSAILKISAFNQRRNKAFNQRFFQIVKAGFSHPRKQIINNLAAGLKIDKEKIKNLLLRCGVHPARRAESLDISEWVNVVKLSKF